MFEGFTLEEQRKVEETRGWKSAYSALTYCTAEAVVMRNMSTENLLDTDVLIATRISGAPDCLDKVQSKWGGYVKPTDPTPLHSMRRTLQETFGWNTDHTSLQFAGIMGPWMYKSTLAVKGDDIVLTVLDQQAEVTPFQATLFVVVVSEECLLGRGGYLKSTKDARWVTVRDLIQSDGVNPDHLYWTMVYICLRAILVSGMLPAQDVIAHQWLGHHGLRVR